MRGTLLFNLREFEKATDGVTPEAVKLLVALIGMAAKSGGTCLPVSPVKRHSELRQPKQHDQIAAQIAELHRRGLIREVNMGSYEIAPKLWKVGLHQPGNGWFPAPPTE